MMFETAAITLNPLALISDWNRVSMVVLGLIALVGGVLLLFHHKASVEEAFRSTRNAEDGERIRRFERRKFRRRSLASALIAAMGILMIALNWAYEPEAFIGLLTIILLLLLAVMFLAFLDLMSVSLETVTKKAAEQDDELIHEYLRNRKQSQDQDELEEGS